MIYDASLSAVAVFGLFVSITLGLSFYFGRRTSSAQSYFAAGGQIHWFVNGVAFAGDYLSAASFLGICGIIAFYGYDGFLYSIGYLAGWVVALLVVAEPLKRLGRFTFADALDAKFQSRGIQLAAGTSALVVSVFYLIPQMVGAGALVKPLLGWQHATGVTLVGAVVVLIVVTAGMVSTTYVQFLKGGLLVLFSSVLVFFILQRGFSAMPIDDTQSSPRIVQQLDPATLQDPQGTPWENRPYQRTRDPNQGNITVWRAIDEGNPTRRFVECQTVTLTASGEKLVNGLPWGKGEGQRDLFPVGTVLELPHQSARTGPLNPLDYLATLHDSRVLLWSEEKEKIKSENGSVTTIYFGQPTPGSDLLMPGNSPTFRGVRQPGFASKLNFLSLMLALFCGTASLPHILIRYYTVKDQAAARKSTVVGIGCIGFFYILTLYIGLGAMTSGALDVTNSNMAAPLLARTFGETLFAVISAIAFTTVLGTVAGLIVAASGAVVHDLISGFGRVQLTDHQKVRVGRVAAVCVGLIAIALGILFEKMNVTFLVGWAFSVAAGANMPSLALLLFWKKTTREGIIAGIWVGMIASLAWILLSGDTYRDVYGLSPDDAIVPFSQPGIVTIPLGFATVLGVSLLTQKSHKM